MAGHLNPDLRHPFPNATYTVDGRFHYTTDASPRTLLLEVDMSGDVAERFRFQSDSVQGHVKDYGNDLASEYDTTYNGGHVAGARSGGPSEEINTVAMLEEVNQYRVDSDMESFKLFEEEVVGSPGDFNKLVLEFDYPDPANPAKIANSERVPTSFEARWTNAAGEAKMKGFKNVLPAKHSGGN